MRFILADWGTSRFRAYLVENGAILERVSSDEGVSELSAGQHQGVFRRQAGHWLDREPDAPVMLVGMVGSREGWVTAPYVPCPASAADVEGALIGVDLGGNRQAFIVPGMSCEPQPGAVDVMRGEETLAFGAGIDDGLICMPGTHSKWVEMRGGRILRFGSYMTGEMYALLRHESMIGRPATEPADPAGFDLGLDTAERNAGENRVGLLHLLFGARAATVSGKLPPARLAPYLSGLLTGDEVNGALSLLGRPSRVTIVAAEPRAGSYVHALKRHGIEAVVRPPEEALIAGLGRILSHRSG